MSRDERDLHHLFRRDIDRLELPPPRLWLPGAQRLAAPRWRSLLAVPAAAGIIALALVVAFLINTVRAPQVATSPSPSALASESAVPSASPSAQPSASPTTSATPLPSSRAVTVHGKLPASGQWAIFVTRSWNTSPTDPSQVSGPARLPTTDAIRAVPLSARATTPRDTIDLVSFTSAVDVTIPITENVLREQFSPDGHRLVLSVISTESGSPRAALVIVDLVAGTAVTLLNDPAYHDVMPAWHPTGDEIAFVRRTVVTGGTSGDAGLWVVRADGSGLRRVLPGAGGPNGTLLFQWNATGTAIGVARGADALQYQLADASTGSLTTIDKGYVGARERFDWRSGSPAFVGALALSSRGTGAWTLVTADANGSGAKVILTDDVADGTRFFRQPRWRPGADDILYMRVTIEGQQAPPLRSTLLVTDANGRAPRVVKAFGSGEGAVAAWTPDGRDIVYLQGLGVAGSLHLIAPDGSNDRLLQAYGGAPESSQDWIDLAVLAF